MNMVEHQSRIVSALTPYLIAFPNNKVTDTTLVIYAKALSELSIDEIDAAMLKLLRKNNFFPSVAEIFAQAENMRDYASANDIPTPGEAWQEAMREAHDKFVYGEWELSTPEIEQAVKSFGKMALCELTPEGMNTARAQFMRIYSGICERKRDRKTNEAVMKSLPQTHIKRLVGGVAEKMALGVGK